MSNLKPFSIRLEKPLYAKLKKNAKEIGIKITDYIRNIFESEVEEETVVNQLSRKRSKKQTT